MNEVIRAKEIPRTGEEANISLQPKEGLDLKDPKNYRPISLLNIDYKIFAKLLEEGLKEFLKRFIKEDQARFLPGKEIRDSLRILLDSVEYYDKKSEKKQLYFFFLDAEKAFDNVNWEFMNMLITKLKLGNNFANAILSNYTKQSVSIVVNNELSKSINIQKGT